MSNFGGKYSNFEKTLNKKVKPLLAKLSTKENELRSLVLQSINYPKKTHKYWDAVRVEIDNIYKEMNTIFANWSTKEIPASYRLSLKQIQKSIDVKKKLWSIPEKTITQMLQGRTSLATQQLLFKSANELFLTSLTAGRGNVIKFTRLTQQVLLSEAQVDLVLGTGFFQAGNLEKAAKVLEGELWSKMYTAIEEKKFIQAGKLKYTPEYYAKMVARVKFHEAQGLASMQQATNYNTDLIQVSSHNTSTAICVPHEGKVFSMSGKSKLFPPLFDTPPYHPNCLHLLFVTFIEGMLADGTLQGFSDFSKGNSVRPPVPAGFVPVKERTLI